MPKNELESPDKLNLETILEEQITASIEKLPGWYAQPLQLCVYPSDQPWRKSENGRPQQSAQDISRWILDELKIVHSHNGLANEPKGGAFFVAITDQFAKITLLQLKINVLKKTSEVMSDRTRAGKNLRKAGHEARNVSEKTRDALTVMFANADAALEKAEREDFALAELTEKIDALALQHPNVKGPIHYRDIGLYPRDDIHVQVKAVFDYHGINTNQAVLYRLGTLEPNLKTWYRFIYQLKPAVVPPELEAIDWKAVNITLHHWLAVKMGWIARFRHPRRPSVLQTQPAAPITVNCRVPTTLEGSPN